MLPPIFIGEISYIAFVFAFYLFFVIFEIQKQTWRRNQFIKEYVKSAYIWT